MTVAVHSLRKYFQAYAFSREQLTFILYSSNSPNPSLSKYIKKLFKNVVTLDDINNYYDEYKKYLSMSPKKRAKENKKLRRE